MSVLSVSGLIEQQVQEGPDAIAVHYPQHADSRVAHLTYRELSHAANRLAAHLRARGIGRGDRVVTSLRPGPEMVTAFLGIVRAGAAYVPVDPADPAERRRLIVRDSAAAAVLTAGADAADYSGLDTVFVVLDAEASEIARRSDALPEQTTGPDDAFYVCYTSGTTGTPKGVVVPHRAVLDFVRSTDYLRLTPADAVAQAAGPAFDAVTFEVWTTLTAGARLIGLGTDTVTDPGRFQDAVRTHGISVAFLTTALFHLIARERPAAFASLRAVLFGGEACDPRRVREVFAAGTPGRLLHVYGPTETTAFATWHEVTEPAEGDRTIPIGRPIGATTAVVVDADDTPVTAGGTGELLLGGPGVATGYLHRPELTGRRFVADRFTGTDGPLYRTGDLVRLGEDGALEFVGRVADRIELRAACTELGEIEPVPTAVPTVSAAASPHETEDGGKHLAAHVVQAAPSSTPAEEDARITRWRETHEALHEDAAATGPGDNLTGWNSSYDALPIPPDHLREWQNATLERIRELPRRRVLEIGAGTGLLMAHLAHDEEVHEYWATGFSPAGVAAFTAQVEADPVLKDKVRLECRGAHDTDGLPAGHFDTIVVNSVIQYFPSLAHLRTVVERALPLLAPGGSLLLGDLRNLDLARCFHTGIALARPGGARGDREALLRAIDQQVATETELLLSPALFDALARDLPAVRAVDVRAKRGRHHNELTRYRYEAVLSTAEPVADLTTAPALRWGRDIAGTSEAEQLLTTVRPAVLRLAGVPNRRVHDEYTAMQSLFDPREGIDLAPQDAPAPDPETLCEMAERLGYRALPTWGESPDLLDIVVVDPAQVPAGALSGVYAAPVTDAESCANTPAAVDDTVDPVVVLRGRLQEQLPLPDCMVPSALKPLDTLPLNADDKVDRGARPAPACTAGRPGTQPGTPIQEIVRDLFAEVVGLPRHKVHAESDFFRIGGHSSAAARLLSRVRETLGADLGSRALHEAPTPAAFAALVGDAPAAVTGPGATAGDSSEFSMRLHGALDTRALKAALEDLGRRHPSLRNSRLGSAGTRLRALAADDHLLELALPADSVDLWSHLPLAAAVARAYGARATGRTPNHSPAARDAAPLAIFGDLPPTPLPGSASQAGDTSYGTLESELDAELHARLARLAAEHGTTLFMVVHAALTVLLTRLGAAGPVTVAAPVPARDTAALREAVGPYGRVLALTVDTSGDPAFTELLRRVRERDLAAYRDGEAALAALPGGLALTVLQECAGRFEAAGLSVRAEHCVPPVPATDLGLTLTERQSPAGAPAGITVTTAFRRETVGETAAASLTGQLTAVLRSALEAPAAPLSRLRLLPGPASGSGVWAGADVPVAEQDMASLFAAQVARAPEALALAGLDYAELDARSDLLAHALIEHRAGPGTCVLTALSSPAGFAVAAIAVAKTGAALLPVDPSLDLAESLRPAVLLLDETADLLLPAVPGAARLVREEATGRLPPAGHWPVPEADRTRPRRIGDPLLLLPGEDGTVAVGGEAVTAATLAAPADAAWLVRGYPDGDAAIGLLSALACGTRVHVPDGSLSHDVPHEVLGWLRRQGARWVLGGADDVLCALVSLARTEGAELNVSGGWAEGRLVVEQVPGAPVRPAPGYRAYLLDSLLRPVGPGETGSLYIAGVGVAQGYAGTPGASGERFLPDPFGGPAGGTARMWRTGRAARLDEDGNLRVLDGPAHDDPFADEFATFVVLADPTGHRALWPATAAVPEGWYETHGEDLYELCLDHINGHLGEPF
ncbi:non-ribosomal peptide synthetase [Streptomyces sp. TLI_185]|uniref:non-ribosomal peptide synthetase n=1 Tax=Streptomyces sp. TLI_185 TaxID=2485151 RepID=UPI000FB1773A|nr:non-ribosomal peptide synthetase [Streptomyces sp. TLI_185]RPF24806.1 amino acid adenylation domain-containing protein [Streptomyces sp. TLI_185]